MATPTNAQLGKLLASYLSTSTLQNELLAKIANKKLIFVVSLQRETRRNYFIRAKTGRKWQKPTVRKM